MKPKQFQNEPDVWVFGISEMAIKIDIHCLCGNIFTVDITPKIFRCDSCGRLFQPKTQEEIEQERPAWWKE